ncbi:MAG: S8 family serine peptidase [Ekhidna sp.]
MRSGLLIILSFSIFTLWSQKPMLQKAQFADQQLSESWIIVKVEPGSSLRLDQDNEVKLLHPSNPLKQSILDGVCRIKLKDGQDPIDFCNELLLQKNVIYAEPIIQDKPLYSPSDPNIGSQTYLSKIKAFEAWDITRGDDDITIGIIDTGISLDHEDLIDNIWINHDDPIDGIDNDENGYIDDFRGYDFADDDNDPNSDKSTHGAGVAGVASASTDNGIGISGIGFNTKIAALKGFKSSTNFSGGLFEAILYGADNGLEVLNLSWGSAKSPLHSEQDIINYAVLEKDVVIVAAAGNDGIQENPEAKFYPASYDNVISVGATDIDDNKWSESTFNYSVDIMAPGSSIFSTLGNNTYGNNLGTSFAAPMVAGVAALLKDQFPALNARQIMERLRVTADEIYDVGNNEAFDGKLGKGRLNAFRAVAETGLKSMRLEDLELNTSIGNQLFFGDTIQIKGAVINYLNNVNNPLFTLSSKQGLQIPTPSIELGLIQSMEGQEINFKVILPIDLDPNSEVELRVDMMDGSYNDFQFIEFKTAPNYVHFGNENTSMTIAANGNLSYTNDSFSEGTGFQSEFGQIMKHAGFFVGNSADSLSDNIIKNYSTELSQDDFIVKKNYKLSKHPTADLFGYSEFEDTARNIVVEQSNLAWNDENFILLRYRIINNSSQTVSNLISGVYTDWNLDDQKKNRSIFNSNKQYNFTTNQSENQFSGTQVIGSGTTLYSNLDIGTFNNNEADIIDEFSDSMIYNFLSTNQIDSAGKIDDGNDVASLTGMSFDQIAPYQSEYVNVVLAVGSSISDLESTLAKAQEKLTSFNENPLVLETFRICDINQVSIDPISGTTFDFFSDPNGQNFLFSGDVFEPTNITRDTVFYARNIDGDYPSDFYQVRLKLFTDIADFEMDSDTLYLDNSTNVVSFTDTSIDAVSWSWDFGQGTIASIQNPSISFSQEGIYAISLTVTNNIGCQNTRVKNLIVANRPPPPSFEDFLICPNESILLTDTNADKLNVYPTDNSQKLVSGQGVDVGPFTKDSIVYVSGIYDGFESEKFAVKVSVYATDVDFKTLQDTLSTTFQLQLNALADAESTLTWFVDDVEFGNESSIFIEANEGDYSVKLQVETIDGCTITNSKNIQINSSPTPIQNDVSKCENESIILQPQNGTFFAFYNDELLTDLIKKGTQLSVSNQEKIFVVGLDDGLPSRPIEVNITSIPFPISINHTVEQVASKKKVSLFADTENNIIEHEWYLNGELIEVSSSPSIFLDSELYEIVLKATSIEGCTANDTISLDLQEEVVVLGEHPKNEIQIYPNPSNGYLNIISQNTVESVSIHSLSGQLMHTLETPKNQLNIDFLETGLYILKASINGEVLESIFLMN